ncbi:hypothetical protein PSTT_03367 [Puccinia striiformis]|uniref:Uncharacterized protein n=1 Tax=Puccinia striiformis TaxID=27350 RepID=A0A2S4VWW5_9BASI|nr:hypothetical protein PSTT_03367 [Puccinia striiformis]
MFCSHGSVKSHQVHVAPLWKLLYDISLGRAYMKLNFRVTGMQADGTSNPSGCAAHKGKWHRLSQHCKSPVQRCRMGGSSSTTTKARGMIVDHIRVIDTDAYQKLLRKEAKTDVFFTITAKMLGLKDLVRTRFDPKTSIVHPRIMTLRGRGYDIPKNLGTPHVPESDAKGQLGPR